jgi:anti-sigma regulatory factor (Ser/Thr protein kinase)
MNLVSNAVKFTRQGGVEISLMLSGTVGQRQEIEWVVKDSGIGREGLRYAMEEMTEPRSLVINRG